jgi:hypothetical protein
MAAVTQRRRSRRKSQENPATISASLPPIICVHCGGPVVQGQNVQPLFSPKNLTWSVHPVLSKPVVLRGIVSADGTPGRSDLSVGEELRQRAAMGGEKERAELAAFESLMAKAIADALVAELREEAAVHGVDVWTWLARETKKDDQDF